MLSPPKFVERLAGPSDYSHGGFARPRKNLQLKHANVWHARSTVCSKLEISRWPNNQLKKRIMQNGRSAVKRTRTDGLFRQRKEVLRVVAKGERGILHEDMLTDTISPDERFRCISIDKNMFLRLCWDTMVSLV